jgi:uncharacterized membrane protein
MRFQTFVGAIFMIACALCIVMYAIHQNCLGFFFGLIGVYIGICYHGYERTGMFDEIDKLVEEKTNGKRSL